MRLALKIFSILFVLCILSVPFTPSIKAGCSEDAYGNCTGTCNCSSYGLCGSCSCKWQSENYCGATGCSTCPTNTPTPTTSFASPVEKPGGESCTSTNECMDSYCKRPDGTYEPDCSSICLNDHCYTTHIKKPEDKACKQFGSWGGCLSGRDVCGGCAAQGYTCQTRFCKDPPNSKAMTYGRLLSPILLETSLIVGPAFQPLTDGE